MTVFLKLWKFLNIVSDHADIILDQCYYLVKLQFAGVDWQVVVGDILPLFPVKYLW